ncbi:flagellar biosynthetic protein FliR [Roseimaritima sediminicola]|uniref:flagellar biosynthetic protein FliR n=1 Tax=Roseimaritima sediminicola TaxID=2662066 RepID=UPI001F3DA56F|nr:flagellar biosynthetic protein FliR [Roseimaritima sediminicola]
MIAAATDLLLSHLVLFLLVLTRLSTLLMAMPAVGVGVPKRVRALLAITLTLLLLPAIAGDEAAASAPRIENLIELAIAIAREALIGMLIGTVIQLLITGMQLGGELISSTGGMQLGDAQDPATRSNMPALARLIGMLVTTVFLSLGGHRLMLTALMDSFQSMAPGQVAIHESMLSLVVGQLAGGVGAGVRLAAPVVTALLLTNLVTGFISRTLPGLNVLAIGLNINALAMLAVMAMAIGGASWIFAEELTIAMQRVATMW